MAAPDAPPALTPAEQFRSALVALCLAHGFTLEPYHEKFDDYDSESGLDIVSIARSGFSSPYYVEHARIPK